MILALGDRRFDVTHRPLVMGVLNRTTDSFFDRGEYWAFDRFLARADQLVTEGTDVLDVGGVKAGPGPEVAEAEELDRIVPAIQALRARFDVPLSVDTWRASVLKEASNAGAVLGNDISGFADARYLAVAAASGASVVATHIRLQPRVADPDPTYRDVVAEVEAFLVDRAERAAAAGLTPDRVVLDAGLDLGKTRGQSVLLVRGSRRLAGLGHPLLLSASNKTFLGRLLDLGIDQRREASVACAAIAAVLGCRVLRVHDVRGHVRLAEVIEALSEAAAAGTAAAAGSANAAVSAGASAEDGARAGRRAG